MEVHAERIQEHPSLSPVRWLCISDVTDGHAVEGVKDGRALDADGKEMLILVVSERFRKKSLLQRQRMINSVFHDELESGSLHSVRMKCLTPDQWERKGKPQSFRPGAPCSAGIGQGGSNGLVSNVINSNDLHSSSTSWQGPLLAPSACDCGDCTM